MYSYWGDRTETGLHVPSAVMIRPPELPINDEARSEAHIASTGVTVLARKRIGKLLIYHKIN